MIRKPWPIIILGLLFFFEPAFKLCFYSLYWKVGLQALLSSPDLKSPYIFFMYFFACPIAGISIFMVKRWSIPVFVLMEVLTVIAQFYNHHRMPNYFPLSLAVSMSLLNTGVVLYFLIPAVFLAYLDPKFRWWESKPRYQVNWDITVSQNGLSTTGKIQNISERGMFFECGKDFDRTEPIHFSFSHLNMNFSFSGQIRHDFEERKRYHYGVEFERLYGTMKSQMTQSIRALEKSDCERRPPRVSNFSSFLEWAHTLLTTGKGLIPSLKRPPSDHKAGKTIKKAS